MSNWDSAYTHKTTEDAVNGLIMCNGSGTYSGVTDNSSNWNTAYTNRVDTWTSPLQFSSNTASIQDATTSQKGAVQLQDSVDTTATKATTPNAVKACVGEDRRNITVILNATHPTYQVDVDFDILQVGQYNLTAGDLTIDVTVSGANGLDTGSEAPNTWYAVYVIYNPTTGTIAGLLSADTTPPSTANPPTLPSGYTVWRNVGWVRNDASSNFTLYCCISDGFCDRGDPSQPDYYDGGTTLYTNGGWYDLDLSAIIPPGAKSVLLSGYINDGTIGRTFRLRANTGSSNVRNVLEVRNQVAGAYAIAMGEVKLDSGRVIEYCFTSSTYNNYGLTICGWRF
ncbi:MAG TPA: hypothetical protein PLI71_09985 [Clostridia bacterium]|nr:hypothetical protein [Clostridia bacterium]